jgi:hypothetical protein
MEINVELWLQFTPAPDFAYRSAQLKHIIYAYPVFYTEYNVLCSFIAFAVLSHLQFYRICSFTAFAVLSHLQFYRICLFTVFAEEYATVIHKNKLHNNQPIK